MEFVKEKSKASSASVHAGLHDDYDSFTTTADLDCDDQPFNDKRIWIGNIERTIPEFLLLKLVQKFGRLQRFDFTYVKRGPDKGKPKGYCFVTYEESTAAKEAIRALNGYNLKDRSLIVKLANKPSRDVQHSQPVEKQSQIEAIEAKLKVMEREETDCIKHKLISSARPPPLMRLNIKKPEYDSSDRIQRVKHKGSSNMRTRPY